jgi:hypothetical protein
MSFPKEFCLRGHDTSVTGRRTHNGGCIECELLRKHGVYVPVIYDRLPIRPLVVVLAARSISTKSLGPSLGRQYLRWKKLGYIPVMSADKIACDIVGVHPFDIWGALWLDPKPTEEVA